MCCNCCNNGCTSTNQDIFTCCFACNPRREAYNILSGSNLASANTSEPVNILIQINPDQSSSTCGCQCNSCSA